MSNTNTLAPLLHPDDGDGEEEGFPQYQPPHRDDFSRPGFVNSLRRLRRHCGQAVSSRAKHFLVMSLVALDVFALLANIFIQLIACETHQDKEPWVRSIIRALETASLAFSSVFLLELIVCLIALGSSYLNSWFHIFDSLVVLLGFVVDVFSTGLTESIGSLIVVLRLWRLAKLSEEVVMGASERIEILEDQLEDLKEENSRLRSHVGS